MFTWNSLIAPANELEAQARSQWTTAWLLFYGETNDNRELYWLADYHYEVPEAPVRATD